MTDLEIMRNPNSDRESVLKAVRESPSLVGWACDAFKDDYEVVMTGVCTEFNADAFIYASPRLRADRRIATECIVRDKTMQCIRFVHPSLLSDRDFILEVLPVQPYVFHYATVPCTHDFFVDCAVANCKVVEYLPDEYTSDRELAMDVIAKGGHILEYLSDHLKDDRGVVVAQFRVEYGYQHLEDASPRLQRDRDVVLEAIANGGYVLASLSDQLKDDREVVLAQFRIEYGGGNLKHASPRLQRDREMVLEAVRTDPTQLEDICLYMEYTPEERERLLSDVEVVTTAVAEYGGSLRYASNACRTNRIVVMTALTSKSQADLRYVPSCLLSDPCIRLCVSANKQSTVDALLTVLETEVDGTCDVSKGDKLMYKHMVGRPFTADTVLSLFEFERDGVTHSMECFRPTLSTERIDALATVVNDCPSEYVYRKFGFAFEAEVRTNDGVLTDDVLEFRCTHYQTPTPNKWMAHGVCDNVADRLQRLGQIADALPYIDRVVRRNKRNTAFRNQCIARVDALAAKVHHPTGAYASIVHKRSFTEAFA